MCEVIIWSQFFLALATLACCTVFSADAYGSCRNDPMRSLAVIGLDSQPVPAQAEAQPAYAENSTSIVGLWHVIFVSGGQPFDEGYEQWHSDGTEILNDIAPPQPADGAGTICFGVYEKTGPASYKLRHPFWIFDATATLIGKGVYLENVTVDRSGNSYTGSFEFTTYGLNGNVTYTATGTLQAQRITID